MDKAVAISHFGNQTKLASALGIVPRSVSGWPDRVPLARALQIEKLTHGKLKVDLSLYARGAQ